ncbi:MAG: hypothetical protein ACOH1K_04645 [Rhodoglobus sp.]
MISSKRSSVVLLAPALMLVLSSCALIEPADTSQPPTAMERCALGHSWQRDTADAAATLLAELPVAGVPATAVEPSGSQTLDWKKDGNFTLSTDMTFTITATPQADQIMTITHAYSGKIVGQALINVDVAIPRNWDATAYEVTTTAVLNDAPVEEVGYVIPRSDFDDVLGLVLTCEAGVLTINPRGTDRVERWTTSN